MKVFVVAMILICLVVIPFTTAKAYSTTPEAPQTLQNGFDFGNGFSQLFSPFQNFIQSLKWPTSIGPIFNLNGSSPTPENFGISNIQLSMIPLLILNAVAWMLNVALQIVNWLKSLL